MALKTNNIQLTQKLNMNSFSEGSIRDRNFRPGIRLQRAVEASQEKTTKVMANGKKFELSPQTGSSSVGCRYAT